MCTAGIAPYMGLRNVCERHGTSYLLPDLANIGHKSGKRKDVAPISHRFRSLEFGVIPAVACISLRPFKPDLIERMGS